ncbi:MULTISPECIES: type IX secretion system protein PorG [unclassified Saccharicrinis]|uniref:type IX secretion system protein PorG n=1 Tax=unclassified Saccharicrinis TaxID=2646859 RepID=UPI003D347F2F
MYSRTRYKVKLRLKAIYVFVGLFVTISFGAAQDKVELGGYVGTSYYLGDLNPQNQFYQPGLSFGGVARYVLDDRYALKGTLGVASLKGSYPDNNVLFPEGDVPYSFSRKVADGTLQMEFNFKSYDHPFVSTTNFTPYISLGLGTSVYKRFSTEIGNNSQQTVFILSLPFGIGAKYKINKWIRVGAEWSFRKTFVDDLDVVGSNLPVNAEDAYGFNSESKIHNTDMYSVASVHMTFSLFTRKAQCNSGY